MTITIHYMRFKVRVKVHTIGTHARFQDTYRKSNVFEYIYNELLNSPLDDKRILYTLYNNKFNTNLLSFIFTCKSVSS